MAENLCEDLWEFFSENYTSILNTLSKYNAKIASGHYLDFENTLDAKFVINLVAAQVISLLLKDKTLYIPNREILLSIMKQSQFAQYVEWDDSSSRYQIIPMEQVSASSLPNALAAMCIDEKGKQFIQEVCAQDIVFGGDLAKKIGSFVGELDSILIVEIKGEEELFRYMRTMRENGGWSSKATILQKKYNYELSNRGALIRNRVFLHSCAGRKIVDNVCLSSNSETAIDYRHDKNFCQTALLHIGVESTGSSGTGFVISEDGYALTCAHVVEGVKEIYATIIIGDGYPVRGCDGFEVYDAGGGEVVYVNKQLDIALLKMEHFGNGFLPVEQAPILPEIGEEVVVYGYPLGYEMPQSNSFGPNYSFYKGYVSSNQVNNGNSVTFLDIDVKSGNSGSPVISVRTGKVIGIISGVKVGSRVGLNEKMPYMIPIQHFIELLK